MEVIKEVLINPEDIFIGDNIFDGSELEKGRRISIRGRPDIKFQSHFVDEITWGMMFENNTPEIHFAKLYTESINNSVRRKIEMKYEKRMVLIRAIRYYVDFEEEYDTVSRM